jgi:2'-5' RNA ligase
MRQFLAAELPGSLRERVSELRATLEPRLDGWRWLAPDGIHLTVRFLGEVEQARDRRAREAWSRVAGDSEPFRVCLEGVGWFPERGAPRVLWVGVRETDPGGALSGLAARLEQAAREQGWEPERRPFRPHLTLARRRRDATRPELPEPPVLADVAGWVRRVVLMRSHLEPGGARYTALTSYSLGGVPDGP